MSADMGQFDARKTTPSSKEAQDQVFAKFKQRRTYQMRDADWLVGWAMVWCVVVLVLMYAVGWL